jgi:uncharacterized membrane protein
MQGYLCFLRGINMSIEFILGMVCGVLLCLFGLALIAARHSSSTEKKEEKEKEEDPADWWKHGRRQDDEEEEFQ